MKKRVLIILLALFMLAACACADSPADPESGAESKDGYLTVLDSACELTKHFDRDLMDKVVPPLETEYYVQQYRESKDVDYIEALAENYAQIAAEYDEYFGDDWKLTYTVTALDEKDEEGIANYKVFDHYYFETYGIDLDSIDAVTFVKAKVHIEGSKGSNDKEKTLQFFRSGGEWYSFYAARFGIKMVPQG